VHKAQGSEWGTVVVALPGHHRVDRALLYTAATRARSRLVLVGSAQAVRSAASRAPPRQTELRQVLEQAVSAEVHT
jgi:exodeoxyribonuclease V alpha subunit